MNKKSLLEILAMQSFEWLQSQQRRQISFHYRAIIESTHASIGAKVLMMRESKMLSANFQLDLMEGKFY